jgi:hypothetical protein
MSYTLSLTTAGQAKIMAAITAGSTVTLTHIAVGSSATPLTVASSALGQERYRASINNQTVSGNVLTLTALVPSTQGGWYMRELGVFDTDGTLIAFAAFPETYKPLPSTDSVGVNLTLTATLNVINAANVAVTVTAAAVALVNLSNVVPATGRSALGAAAADASNVSGNASAWRNAIGAQEIDGHGAFQNLRSALRRGRSAAWLLAGDSTGNETEEWAHQFMLKVAAANPSLNIVQQVWDMAAQSYLAPTTVAAGTAPAYIDFLAAPALASSACSLPATAALTGDFSAAVQITAADYTPAALQILLRLGNAGDNNVFWLGLNTNGTLRVTYNTNAGANADDQTATSTVSLSGVTDGVTKLWVGFTYDRDNGAGGSDFKFYTSTDGTTWTQLGSTVTKTTGNLIRTNGASNSWWLGGTGASFMFVGKVHAVRVLAGSPSHVTGVQMLPEEISTWTLGNETYQTHVGQTLWFYNASLSGQTLDYHTATTARTAAICLSQRTELVLFSSMHNYGNSVGATYRTALDTAKTAFAAAMPNATFAGSTQNPQISPRTRGNQTSQDQRARDMVQWCRQVGIGCVNGYEAFVGSGLALSTLINSDGVHPNTDGSLLWASAAYAEWVRS